MADQDDAPGWSTFRLAAIATGTGLAIWLVPASIHIVSWFGSPQRVAWLPPLWQMGIAIGSSLAAIAAIAIALGARPVNWKPLERLARALAPLLVLWLWALPFLPWVAAWTPLVLLFAGPLRWAVAAAAIVEVAWSLATPIGWPVWRASPSATRTAVFSFSVIAYLTCGLASAAAVGPAGDEPHYLVIAHSLSADHDLKIENNHTRGDYRAFFAGALRPDYLARGKDGEIYSIHAPGLPAVLLPGYALAGYRGAVAMMCLIAAAAALTMYDVAGALAGPRAALLTCAVLSLSVPVLPHAWLIYPEIPAALLVGWTLLWLVRPPAESALVWAVRGLAIGALPWLHTKYVVLLVALAPFLVWHVRRRPIDVLALLLPIGLSLALWCYYFYAIYGTIDPQAPYGGSVAGLLLRNIPHGVLGLLFDQKFGLLVYSPIYLFAVPGLWLTLHQRESRLPALAALCGVSAFMLSTTRLYMFWGGASAPARFLVPVIPLLAPFVAVAISRARSPVARASTVICVVVGLTVTALSTAFPDRRLLFSDPHGTGRLIDLVQGAAAWSATLPTFTEPDWEYPLARLAAWLVALGAAVAVAMLVARRARSRPVFWAAVAEGLSLIAIAGALSRNIAASQRQEVSLRGQTDLLTAYDGLRLRPFDYRRLGWLEDPDLAALMTVDVTNTQRSENQGAVAGPLALPAGEYVARVRLAGNHGSAQVSVVLGGRLTLATRNTSSAVPVEIPFELPVDFDDVSIYVDRVGNASNLSRVELVARHIVPRSARPPDSARSIQPIAGRPGALLIYTNDDTYPEGDAFWTKNSNTGSVLIAPAGASSITATLHVGTAADVDVQAGETHTSFHMTPSEDRDIEVQTPGGSSVVSLRVRASASFRPSEAQPPSPDTRRLGCHVRLSLR